MNGAESSRCARVSPNGSSVALALLCLLSAATAAADTVFSSANGLVAETNGQLAQLVTGFSEHNFVTASDDSRFVVFSSPDPTTNNGIIPSSDIYVFDRAVGQTRRIVDHNSSFDGFNTFQYVPTTAALSPDNGLLAYGVGLTTRQGQANPRRGVTLAVARASDGLILEHPAGLVPVSDDLAAAYVGLDWDPGGNSFVTTAYVPATLSVPAPVVSLPAIVRFTRQGDAGWSLTPLTTPHYFNDRVPPAARTYLYPALSPSGAGLAFFSLTWPDVLTGSQAVTATLVVSDANFTQATALLTLPTGRYPTGLSWSRDGTQLFISHADQVFSGTGWLPGGSLGTSVIRAVDTASGAVTTFPDFPFGAWPATVNPLTVSPPPPPPPPPPTSDDGLCFPIRLPGGGLQILCL